MIIFHFHKSQFENMIDFFTMFSLSSSLFPPLFSLVPLQKNQTLLPDSLKKTYKGALVNEHSVPFSSL